jgi:hypothetical protein
LASTPTRKESEGGRHARTWSKGCSPHRTTDVAAHGCHASTAPCRGGSGSLARRPPDYAAELQQLAALKQQGILTEEEFEAKKKQILGL